MATRKASVLSYHTLLCNVIFMLIKQTILNATNFNTHRAKLTIIILKAEGLPVRKDGDCDPFVDIQVSPYYKRRMHSEVHQKTQNPVFNQSFESEVPPYEIRGQTIHFTVLDFSQQLAHEPIGSVAFKMDSLDRDAFNAGKEFTLWKKIDKVYIIRFSCILIFSLYCPPH